ncbi:MAG: AsmA-like C-terminal region-containing protein [Verrucomicrobiota bacterium]
MSSKPGFWRTCRIAFRCARFTVWGAVVLLLLAYGWLNQVGLPGFLKTRLVAALHDRGVELEFSRMRLRFYHGLVCDQVRVGTAQGAADPVFSAREVQLRINYPALLHLRLQVDGLVLRNGRLSLLLAPGNSLALTNLQGQLRILPEDTWSLDQFSGDFAGATFRLAGEVAHAPECRNWKMFAAAKTAGRGSVQSSLRDLSDTLKQIQFEGKPQINARLNGDARDVHSFSIRVSGRAPGVRTPWLSTSNLEFAVLVLAPTNAPLETNPAWDYWTNLQPFQIDWLARCARVESAGLKAEAVDCTGSWKAPELALTKCTLRLGRGTVDATAKLDIASRELACTANSAFDLPAVAAWFPAGTREQLDRISWTALPQVQVSGSWMAPAWTNRGARWPDGLANSLRLRGDLAATNAHLSGVAFLDSARTHFTYVDRVWTLPDLKVSRGRTALELDAEANATTKNFHCLVGGKVDADVVRPFLTNSNAVQGFGHLSFRDPAALVLEVTGNLRDFSTLSVTGRVVATDFAVREQWVDSVLATLSYTNFTADFYHPQLVRADGAEKFAAEKVTLDLAGQKLLLHGGQGHILPSAVAAAIGPETAAVMEPYHFLAMPEATVEGCIPLKFQDGELVTDGADLRFNVMGTVPFRWRKFETPAIAGTIHWLGHNLVLTNVVADCYGGTANGWGVFDVETPGDGTDFAFFLKGTNVDFNAMGRALWSPTNRLRGALSGQLTVTSANSSDWRTWNGYGQAQLQNGLLWDAPVLGLMSPVLNRLMPGLDIGNSRATEGAGSFTMTNGVIFTDTLEIRSLTMRLDYVGTVDLQENVAARVKSQLLRNTPVIGTFVSTFLSPVSKAFECEVTGTLDEPKIKPAYIPFSQLLTAPLHPIRTVERIFALPSTNSPPRP